MITTYGSVLDLLDQHDSTHDGKYRTILGITAHQLHCLHPSDGMGELKTPRNTTIATNTVSPITHNRSLNVQTTTGIIPIPLVVAPGVPDILIYVIAIKRHGSLVFFDTGQAHIIPKTLLNPYVSLYSTSKCKYKSHVIKTPSSQKYITRPIPTAGRVSNMRPLLPISYSHLLDTADTTAAYVNITIYSFITTTISTQSR